MFTRHHAQWFQLRSEGACNWLALGLLLAAWNLSDNDAVRSRSEPLQASPAGGFVTVRTVRTRQATQHPATAHAGPHAPAAGPTG